MTLMLPTPLNQLLGSAGIIPEEILGRPDVPIAGMSDHAQNIRRHWMFLARRGTTIDSHLLISDAIERGAAAVLVDRPIPWHPGITVVRVPDARMATGPLCHAFQNHPGRRMLVAGVTGTNGKTTVTHMVESILQTAGMRTGLIGTVYYRWNQNSIPAETTTPSAIKLSELMARMEADRVEAVVMEVSSHAIDQWRVGGIPFRVGALTNVGQDHLDYHGGLPAYIGVKRQFFFDYIGPVPGSTAIINLDDPVGEELASNYPHHRMTYSIFEEKKASIRATNIGMDGQSTRFHLNLEGREAEVQATMIGTFNLYNMLAAAGMAYSLGVDAGAIAEGLGRCRAVPGRFERIVAGQDFQVVVDFAHTPTALERMLQSARCLTEGRLITVFGCGGQRDSLKRPLMGQVVGRYSDFAIITNDNTRKEDPEKIAGQTLEGLLNSGMRPNRAQILLDRRKAIEMALHLAQPGDTVIIAGRGHEQIQDLRTQKVPFDDREVAASLIRQMLADSAFRPVHTA